MAGGDRIFLTVFSKRLGVASVYKILINFRIFFLIVITDERMYVS